LSQNGLANNPEICIDGSRLDWYCRRQAVTVYKIIGSKYGSESFDLSTWSQRGSDVHQYYYVDHGTLGIFS
jgi:hypothetical protein